MFSSNVAGYPFYVLDFGDSLHSIPDMRQNLKTVGSTEFNQCALTTLADGLEWIGKWSPRRIPRIKRIGLVAIELRAAELKRAGAMESFIDDEGLGKSIRSALHSTIQYSRDRDIRLFPFFLIPASRCFNDAEIRAIEIVGVEISKDVHVPLEQMIPIVLFTQRPSKAFCGGLNKRCIRTRPIGGYENVNSTW